MVPTVRNHSNEAVVRYIPKMLLSETNVIVIYKLVKFGRETLGIFPVNLLSHRYLIIIRDKKRV